MPVPIVQDFGLNFLYLQAHQRQDERLLACTLKVIHKVTSGAKPFSFTKTEDDTQNVT